MMLDMAALAVVMCSIPYDRTVQLGAGICASGLAYLAHEEQTVETLETLAKRRNDYYKYLQGFHGYVTTQTVEPVRELPDKSNVLTDLSANAAKYPHVLIIGKTGAGKSTIAQALAAESPGKRFAIAPHADPSKLDEEWKACHGVFCAGRNYGTPDDPEVSYDDLIHNRVENASAFQVLRALHGEMDRRYRDPAGFDSHEPHDWFLDETPAIAKNLDKYFSQLVSPQAYEARKVKLRLWIITQNDNVSTMKLEGQGKVRDNFTYLYLGDQAKRRLRYLCGRGALPMSELNQPYKRLAIVDEVPCEVPDIEVMNARIDAVAPESRFCQHFSGEIVLPALPSKLPKTWDDFTEHRDCYEERLVWGLDNNKSKSTIITELWGYKAKNYELGKQFYDRLIPESIEA